MVVVCMDRAQAVGGETGISFSTEVPGHGNQTAPPSFPVCILTVYRQKHAKRGNASILR